MHDPLAPLLADGVIDEVVARLKSGKEAELWLVRHGAEIVAAKVYKARQTRSFKNDAVYREGRQVRNSRTQRAMDRGSRFGREAAEDAWKTKEADALHALHAAGVHVPRPVLFYEGVLLMELVVDAAGRPAPRLVDAPLGREQAAALYVDLRSQAVRMLCCDLIHGDLSPYNVLAGRDGPVIIDFPQVIGAAHNSQAERFFLRDLDNVRRHLEGLDPALRARAGDGREIWKAYVRRELTPEFVPSGRLAEPTHPPHAGARPHHGPAHGPPRGQRPGSQPQQQPRQAQQPQPPQQPRQAQAPQHQHPRQAPQHQQPRQAPQPQHPQQSRQAQAPQHQPHPRQAQQTQGRGPRSPEQAGARDNRPAPGPRPPRPQGPPREQGRRSPNRAPTRESPMPVVVRVQRSPLGPSHPAGQPGQPGPATGPTPAPAPRVQPHHGEPPQPGGGRRRRRRRR